MISSCSYFHRGALFFSFLISFFLFFQGHSAKAQTDWKLADNQGWLKIYTRPMAHSKIKSIKVEATLAASASQLLAAIVDINACGDWVYSSKKNVLIKQLSPLDLIYYAEVTVPWPIENRDYVVHVVAEQHPQSKVITINSPCIPGYVEEKPGIVRISKSVAKWTITPISKNQVKIEYLLEVDPKGSIPPWLVNLFATKGPYETFMKLKVHVQKEVYRKASFPGIVN